MEGRRSSSSASQNEYNPFRRYQQTQQEAVAPSSSPTESHSEWKVAVAAYKRADDAQAALPTLKQRLKDAQARLDQDEATLHALRDKNKSTYDELHSTSKESGKKSIIPIPWKSSSKKKNSVDDHPQLPRQDTFNASFLAEANALHVVDASRELRDELQAQLAGRVAASASLSAAFEAVRDAAVLLFPPSVVAASLQLAGAAQLVSVEDDAVEQAHRLATDMAKARQDAQMSHLHLCEVLNTTDAAHESERRASGSFGPMAQVDVHNKYQKALKLAVVCLFRL
ncbi:hypothetical protein EXIGLDRAFT_275133 [Exidia glandulosa HHB12029]|uniref:Uncharacterized protein n=1 Tax=Exidia glandulosa HHB12029 TaxID=1314781 RepID=A0A165M836_EXIGL|nr:hypothetical protein EXIGLDRAFT_275133 [Exidia glandulosa HHB12029]